MDNFGKKLSDALKEVSRLGQQLQELGDVVQEAMNKIERLDLVVEAAVDVAGRKDVQEAVERRVVERAEAVEKTLLDKLRAKVEAGLLTQVLTVTERSVVFCRYVDPKNKGRIAKVVDASQLDAQPLLGKQTGEVVGDHEILGVYDPRQVAQ